MGIGSKNRPFKLESYNPAWKEWYQRIAREIRPIFGDNLVLIEHIGSTSIDCIDMVAKPNIDVLVEMSDLNLVTQYYEQFKALGYTPLGREYVGNGDEYVVKDDLETGRRLESIHILETGHPQIASYRALREYLKSHPADRARYVALKQKLYAEYESEYKQYDSGKAGLIEELKTKAAHWAKINLQN